MSSRARVYIICAEVPLWVMCVWHSSWNEFARLGACGIVRETSSQMACHIWMSQVAYEGGISLAYDWEMAHMNESGHIWMSHVANEWVMSHTSKSCCIYVRHVMSHIWMSHVTHMNESCHTYEWVMSHICMSHVTHINQSALNNFTCPSTRQIPQLKMCHTYEPYLQHLSLRAIDVYEWVYWHVSRIWIRLLAYGVATTSRLLKIIGLFCERAL